MNELVTNSFKYAYPEKCDDVQVEVHSLEPGRLQLIVSDQGVGLPPHHDENYSKSLGMKLINSLSSQLGGEPKWQDTGPGTRFTLDFRRQDGEEKLRPSTSAQTASDALPST